MTAPIATPDARPLDIPAVIAVLSGVLFGHILQLSNGTNHPQAFALTSLVVVASLAALVIGARGHRVPELFVVLAMAVGFAVMLTVHVTRPPAMYLHLQPDSYELHHAAVAVVALLAGAALVSSDRQRRYLEAGLLAAFVYLGLWLLKTSPRPIIDVFFWHKEAYAALASGVNPYAITMPNIYGHTQWFAPGLADNTRVFVGYPYPPVTMLLGAVGHFVAGDYRYMNLVALAASGVFIASARPGRVATLAAIAFLFTQRGLFVLEQGWTESLSILMLSATVFAACRAPRALPWVFGLMMGTKQYFIFAVPLVPLLLGTFDVKTNLRFLLKAAIIPVALMLPFFLWDPGAFINSVVIFQSKQPFRADALSVLARTAENGVNTLPMNLSFVAVLVPLGLGLWRAPRTPAGFALTFAAAVLAFFFFAKQAFANYYFLVLGGLLLAGASWLTREAVPASTAGTETRSAPS